MFAAKKRVEGQVVLNIGPPLHGGKHPGCDLENSKTRLTPTVIALGLQPLWLRKTHAMSSHAVTLAERELQLGPGLLRNAHQ
eukprot:150503-Rhodomonas_salina.1